MSAGNYYGTPLTYVNETLIKGIDVFLKLRCKEPGIKKKFQMLSLFWHLRIWRITRPFGWSRTDSADVIAKRIEKAKEEIALMRE